MMVNSAASGDVVEQAVRTIVGGRSVVLNGVMGVGKSHLMREVTARLRQSGWRCTTINANVATATIPFGALAEFAVGGDLANKPAVLAAITDMIRSLGAGRAHLIVVDDAPWLDDQSVAVFHQLLVESDVQIIATARSSDRESEALGGLWHRLDFERIEVLPLADHDAAAVVHEYFGSGLELETVGRIVNRAEGNPLFLIELARAAVDGVPSGLTKRLREMVVDRIARLDGHTRAQLEFVAVADPFDTDLAIADTGALELLEREGLVTTFNVANGVVARPAHPLYGEIVRDSLTALQRKEVSRRLAQGFSADPRTRPGDALRLAGWLLACGDSPSVELAIPAAREAISLLEVDLANVLVGIATAEDPGFDALFVAGEVARMTGDIERAMEWFDRAFEVAEDSSDLRTAALAMGQIHGFYLNRPDEAVRILSAAADRMTDETQRLELEIERVLFGSMLGRYADVLEAAELVLNNPECGVEARWTACTNVAWAQVQLIDLRKVHGHLDTAFALIDHVVAERPGEADLLRGVRINVLVEEGRLAESLIYNESSEADKVPKGLTRFAASQAAWMSGDIDVARRLLDGSIEQLSAFDAYNAYPYVSAASAVLAFVVGEPERALAAIDDSTTRGGGTGMWDQLWLARAQAWSEATTGHTTEAVAVLLEGVKVGLATSHYGWSLLALHDAVAWGAAPAVADMLRPLRADMHGAPLMMSIADSVLALADDDLDGAVREVANLLSLGSRWHAGVVNSGLALGLHAAGRDVEARRAAASAMAWLPPKMPHTARLRAMGLSQSQLTVVREALGGRTDRDIADALFLSPRTVSNHLGAIYASLEVSGRVELGNLLSPHS